jgi:RNA polymerase sigma-B factor
MATSSAVPSGTPTQPRVSPTAKAADHAATRLLDTLTALPQAHPSRPALRERVIEAWLPMARHLANRYAGRGEPVDDLVQVATVGLIKAVDKFDPSYGVDFTGYAIPTIVGEVKRYFRDRTWAIRVPRRLQNLRPAITAATSALTQTLGRSPTVPDIAALLGITEEDVLEGLEVARAYTTTSLSTPVGATGDTELGELIGADDHRRHRVRQGRRRRRGPRRRAGLHRAMPAGGRPPRRTRARAARQADRAARRRDRLTDPHLD